MKEGFEQLRYSSSEVGFTVLQQLGLNSKIQAPGSGIRERAAGDEGYG